MTKVKNKITPDTILKNFWKDNKRFADLFNACFFDGNPKLNPDDLTEVDTDVSSLLQFHGYAETVKRIVDVVKKSAYGVDFVILGIENQSKIHYAMPLRHMLGDAFSYLKEYNEIAKKHKKDARISPDTIVTVPTSCPVGTRLVHYSSFSIEFDSFSVFLFLDIIL